MSTDVKFCCPSTSSAGWLLLVGRVFHINTRLKAASATNRCLPSKATDVGSIKVLPEIDESLELDSPRTISGIRLAALTPVSRQIKTRRFGVSARATVLP